MGLQRKRGAFVVLAVLAFGVGAQGCAVLTESQTAEVKRFAEAAAAYDTLPGSLVGSYATLASDLKVLSTAHLETKVGDEEEAGDLFSKLTAALDREERMKATAGGMDGALGVLGDYAEVLSSLTSDDLTDSLQTNAVALGKSMDDFTDKFNEAADKYNATNPASPREHLPSKGGEIAQAIRGAAGVFIRMKQANILRDVVDKADPLVEALMDAVIDISDKVVVPGLDNLESNLGTQFKEAAKVGGRMPSPLVDKFYQTLRKAREVRHLATSVSAAAAALKKAHRVLVEKTRHRTTLSEAIDEIQALRHEVSEARKAKGEVDK